MEKVSAVHFNDGTVMFFECINAFEHAQHAAQSIKDGWWQGYNLDQKYYWTTFRSSDVKIVIDIPRSEYDKMMLEKEVKEVPERKQKSKQL